MAPKRSLTRKRKAVVLEEQEDMRTGPFVLSARDQGSTPPATFDLVEDSDVSARALLGFLRAWGFDSRVGGLCCAPVTVSGTHCLLVSLRLVTTLASVFAGPTNPCRSLAHLRSDPGIRRLQHSFFPWDASQEAKRLAELSLPLWPFKESCSSTEICDELRLLDIEVLGAYWASQPEPPASVEPAKYVELLKRVVCRMARSLIANRHGLPRAVTTSAGTSSLALGRALCQDQVDENALHALMATLGLKLGPAEHVGYGWRLTATRIRSPEETSYDEAHGHAVGALEVLAERAVPLPDLDLSWGAFALLGEAPEIGLVKWLQKNAEARRLLCLTRGRRLCGTPRARDVETAREQL
jgi:hypothetical protein